MKSSEPPLIVLMGGGVESTMLVSRMLKSGTQMIPVHVRCGFIWEECETDYIWRFLTASAHEVLLPLEEVKHPVADTMPGHWALTGKDVPHKGDTAKSIELPLRNLSLLTAAATRLAHLPQLHLLTGTTADNSYSDGTRDFFDDCERRLSRDFRRPVKITTPLIHLHKPEVIRQADRSTLALSFSCIGPVNNLHCGRCYKCGRRQDAFRQAGVDDPTIYARGL